MFFKRRNGDNLVVVRTGSTSPKSDLEQLRAEIQQLRNITAQQEIVASKLIETYMISDQMMAKLCEVLERITELQANLIDRTSRHHHTNVAA
jgi:hypothetical protein